MAAHHGWMVVALAACRLVASTAEDFDSLFLTQQHMLLQMMEQKMDRKTAANQEMPAAAKRVVEENQGLQRVLHTAFLDRMKSNATVQNLDSEVAANLAELYYHYFGKELMPSAECSQTRQDLINVKNQLIATKKAEVAYAAKYDETAAHVRANNQELQNSMHMVLNKQGQLENTVKQLLNERVAGEKYVQQVTAEKNWLQKGLQVISKEQDSLKDIVKKYAAENEEMVKAMDSVVKKPELKEDEGDHMPSILSHLQSLISKFSTEKKQWMEQYRQTKEEWSRKYDNLEEEYQAKLGHKEQELRESFEVNMSLAMKEKQDLTTMNKQFKDNNVKLFQSNAKLQEENRKVAQERDKAIKDLAAAKLDSLEREKLDTDFKDLDTRFKDLQNEKAKREKECRDEKHGLEKELAVAQHQISLQTENISSFDKDCVQRTNIWKRRYEEITHKTAEAENDVADCKNQIAYYSEAYKNVSVDCVREKQRLTEQADMNIAKVGKQVEDMIAQQAMQRDILQKDCMNQMAGITLGSKDNEKKLRQAEETIEQLRKWGEALQHQVSNVQDGLEKRFQEEFKKAMEKSQNDTQYLQAQLRTQLDQVGQERNLLSKYKMDLIQNVSGSVNAENEKLSKENTEMKWQMKGLMEQTQKVTDQLKLEHKEMVEKLEEAKLDGAAQERTREEKAMPEVLKDKTSSMYNLVMESRKKAKECEAQMGTLKAENQDLRSMMQYGHESAPADEPAKAPTDEPAKVDEAEAAEVEAKRLTVRSGVQQKSSEDTHSDEDKLTSNLQETVSELKKVTAERDRAEWSAKRLYGWIKNKVSAPMLDSKREEPTVQNSPRNGPTIEPQKVGTPQQISKDPFYGSVPTVEPNNGNGFFKGKLPKNTDCGPTSKSMGCGPTIEPKPVAPPGRIWGTPMFGPTVEPHINPEKFSESEPMTGPTIEPWAMAPADRPPFIANKMSAESIQPLGTRQAEVANLAAISKLQSDLDRMRDMSKHLEQKLMQVETQNKLKLGLQRPKLDNLKGKIENEVAPLLAKSRGLMPKHIEEKR